MKKKILFMLLPALMAISAGTALPTAVFAGEGNSELFNPDSAGVDHTWGQFENPETTWDIASQTLTIEIKEQSEWQWGNQVFFSTGITTLDTSKEYQFSFTGTASTDDCGEVTFKAFDDNDLVFSDQNLSFTTTPYNYVSEWATPLKASTNGCIVFDFGWDAAQTVTITNISIKERNKVVSYTISDGTSDLNGIIEIDKATAAVGETVTVTVTPNGGYKLKSLVYNDGTDHEITADQDGKYLFTMPEANVTVTAEFEELLYFFDFETKPFENGWTTIDADGDGYDWGTDTDYGWDLGMGIEGGRCAISRSYENYVGARNANNWMFSPAITIPGGGAIVSWYEKSQDYMWPDSYTVYASETNTSTDPNGMTVICATHGAAGNDAGTTVQTIETWTQKTVELSAKDYAGKTVYIAFQHQDCDSFYLKIDNFAVEALPGELITNGTAEGDKETNHGYISIDKMTAEEGETVTITVEPDEGYQLKSLDCSADPASANANMLYLDIGIWGQTDPAGYFAHFQKDGGSDFGNTALVKGENNYYACEIPDGADTVTFLRVDINDFSTVWNETFAQSIPSDKNQFAITSWGEGFGAKCTGEWTGKEIQNTKVTTTKEENGTYTFTMPAYAVTVTAEFELHVHAIKTTYAKVEAKCEEAGHKAYYECDCGKYFSDEDLTNEITDLQTWLAEDAGGYLTPLGHSMTHHPAVAPTCTQDGTVEYWTCSHESGVYYANEQGTSTLTSIVDPKLGHDIDKVNGTPATEGADGFKDAYKCKNCGKYFEDEAGTKLIGDESAYNAWKLAEGKIPALNPQKENGLSGGAIAGIVIGGVLDLALILYVLGYFFLYRKGKFDNKKIRVIYSFFSKGKQGSVK